MLVEHTLFGVRDKVQMSIDRLREFEPEEGYYVAFSGGKDSCVVKDLVIKSGAKHEFHFNRSMEPPELIYYIREHHPDVTWHLPKKTMWQLIEHKMMPPTRIIRYCCAEMKENDATAKGRVVVTGVRWEESVKRAARQMVEVCYTDNSKRFLHPIIDWTSREVWEYIHANNLPYCNLYDEGFKRLGCVMCPMSGTAGMKRDIERWPKIAKMYQLSCNKAFARRIEKEKTNRKWTSGPSMYEWWIEGKCAESDDPDQQRFFFE
jgi:phosphoadenosine phosphosulfate reductase